MLAHQELLDLYRSLEDHPTLSVYIDGDEQDPAARSAWKVRLEGEVGRVRQDLEGDDAEDFEAAWALVWGELREHENGFLPGAGLAAFATRDRLVHVARLPVAPRTLVRWERGLRAAPYVRLLKQERRVVVVLTDRERARIFRYENAELTECTSLRVATALGDLADAGMAKRSGRASGRRGETATDHAQRIVEVGAERLLARVAETVEEEAGRDGFILLGGTGESVARVAGNLPRELRSRAVERPSLHLEMELPALREAVREAASGMTEAWQKGLVDDVLDAARAGGKGALGRDDTTRALRERRVGMLLVARDFVANDADLADRCVGTALAQGAAVEEVGGAQGERLMAEAEGLAARLRFRLDGQTEDAAAEA